MKKSLITLISIIFIGWNCTLLAASGIWDRGVILTFGSTNSLPGTSFNNQNLGSFVNTVNYRLRGGLLKTWKNGGDDITGANLFYRVVPAGMVSSAPFTSVNLPFFQNLTGTPGDQQWQNDTMNIAFMAGLSPGNYQLELYFEASYTSGTAIGTHIDNNNNANYIAGFTIIAPPPECNISLGNDTSFCGAAGITLGGNFPITPDGDSLTIIYNATMGQTGLVGASKVYFHSGYELVPFGGVVGWVGNWGQDDGLGQMTNMGNNLWKITINPKTYYDLDTGVTINGIIFVFRNADGTATGKDNNGNDIFMQYSASPNSSFQGVSGTRYTAPYTSVLWSTGATTPTLPVAETGTYWINLTTSSGCVATDTINIVSGSLPVVNIAGNTLLCPGQSTTLTADGNFSNYTWSNGSTGNSITVNQAGEYSVVVTNSNGCSGIDVAFVNSLALPVADFNFSVFNTNTINFSVLNHQAGQTYSWNFGNGNTSNSGNANASQTYNSNGTYQVRLIVQNACGRDTIIKPVNIIGLGTSDVMAEKQMKVYPNPVNQLLNIEFPEGENGIESRIKIMNILGEILIEQNIAGKKILQFPFEQYPQGTYFIQLLSEKKNITQKIIKP
ncbi:MAG: PKD domain-containing protein [Bacteroidota bacterium]